MDTHARWQQYSPVFLTEFQCARDGRQCLEKLRTCAIGGRLISIIAFHRNENYALSSVWDEDVPTDKPEVFVFVDQVAFVEVITVRLQPATQRMSLTKSEQKAWSQANGLCTAVTTYSSAEAIISNRSRVDALFISKGLWIEILWWMNLNEKPWKTQFWIVSFFSFHKLTFIHRERTWIDLTDVMGHIWISLQSATTRYCWMRNGSTWTILKSEQKNLDENLCSVFRFSS